MKLTLSLIEGDIKYQMFVFKTHCCLVLPRKQLEIPYYKYFFCQTNFENVEIFIKDIARVDTV